MTRTAISVASTARSFAMAARFAVLLASLPLMAQDFTHPATGMSAFTVTGTHSFFDLGGADCDGTGGE